MYVVLILEDLKQMKGVAVDLSFSKMTDKTVTYNTPVTYLSGLKTPPFSMILSNQPYFLTSGIHCT